MARRFPREWWLPATIRWPRFVSQLTLLIDRVPLERCPDGTRITNRRTIPIVFATVSDPVGAGFVASFPRPGGNVTGFTNIEPTMAGKWLELLKEIAPRVERVAMLFNPATAPYAEVFLNPFKAAAAAFAVEVIVAPVRDKSELESAIAAQARESNGGLIVVPESFVVAHRAEVIALAARHRLPTVYPFRYFVTAGGLLSYGNDQPDNFRRAATYIDRILKGAKPNELPVQAPVKFELVINLKTAKALGITVPLPLSGRADELFE
jgi:putative tryptophan/tyrosine transport system substrate-binding protein